MLYVVKLQLYPLSPELPEPVAYTTVLDSNISKAFIANTLE